LNPTLDLDDVNESHQEEKVKLSLLKPQNSPIYLKVENLKIITNAFITAVSLKICVTYLNQNSNGPQKINSIYSQLLGEPVLCF
jgi:hypothetical protein